jgi:hypothetical protein
MCLLRAVIGPMMSAMSLTMSVIIRDRDAVLLWEARRKASAQLVSHDVHVLLDDAGIAIGVELDSPDAEIPFSELREAYRLPDDVLDALRRFEPSVSAFLRQDAAANVMMSVSVFPVTADDMALPPY